MAKDNEPLLIRPDGRVEPLRGVQHCRPFAEGYAPVLPRLQRGEPAAPADRRRRARAPGEPWRGLRIDRCC